MRRKVVAVLVGVRARVLSRRAGVGAALVVLLAVPLGVAAQGKGFEPSRLPLSGGGAWLASVPQGLVTLIDGASEQVIGSVRAPGAQRGDAVSVVQSGSSAFVVNGTQGTVARVDGGTYEASEPIRFGGGGSLEVLAGERAAYVIDGSRRVASEVDPKTLRVRDRLSLAAQPGPGQSVVDGAGRLWVIDRQNGALTWFDRGKRVRPAVGGAAARLLLAEGRPVLVDPAGSRLGPLTADGTVAAWSCLEVRSGDQAQLLGSATSARVFAAVPASGTLVASAVGRDDCRLSVEVGKAGDKFGPLAESSGFVFVPNWSSGHTLVVDVAAGRVAADLTVGKPGSRLELLAKDGFVFYNDLDGDRAGVIRFDGGQWRLGKALAKFDKSDTGKGLLTPAGENAAKDPAADAAAKTGKDKPKQPDPAPDNGADDLPPAPDQNPSGGDLPPGVGPPPGEHPPPGQNPPPGENPPPTDPPTEPPPVPLPPVVRDITWEPNPVVRGRQVTFTGTVDNADDATWAWTVLDDGVGTLHQASSAGTMTYTLPADWTGGPLRRLQIRLQVTNAAGAGELTSPVAVAAAEELKVSLSCTPAAPSLQEPVTCTGREPTSGNRGTWSWTVDGPGVNTGPEPGTPGAKLTRKFDDAGTYRVTLTVSHEGQESQDSVNINVADRCTLSTTGWTTELDLRRNAGVRNPTEIARIGVKDCFVHNAASEPKVNLPSWLSGSIESMTWDSDDGGTGQFSVDVTLTGTAPKDGQNLDVVEFTLKGDRATYDVLANKPPVFLDSWACDLQPNGDARIVIKAGDADVDSLTATVRVGGGSARDMRPFSHGSDGFFELVVPASDLPSGWSTYIATVRDRYGEEASGSGGRGTC